MSNELLLCWGDNIDNDNNNDKWPAGILHIV